MIRGRFFISSGSSGKVRPPSSRSLADAGRVRIDLLPGGINDIHRHKDDDVLGVSLFRLGAEHASHERQVAKDWHLVFHDVVLLLLQASQDNRLAVPHLNGCGDLGRFEDGLKNLVGSDELFSVG